MPNKYFVHSFLMKSQKLEKEEVVAVYMPPEISSYWERVITIDRQFGFKISTFRDFHYHNHRDVICINMDDKALIGKEPWLLLDPEVGVEKSTYTANYLLNRYQRFLHKRIEMAEQYEKNRKEYATLLQYEAHLVSAKIKPVLKKVSLSTLLTHDNFKQYLTSWIFFDFMKRKDSYLENHNTTVLLKAKKSENRWTFPEDWGICAEDSEYVLMSKDFVVNNKRTTYAYKLNLERKREDLLIEVNTFTKSWLMSPLINPVTGYINIPKDQKTRSLYIWNETNGRVQKLTLRKIPDYSGVHVISGNIYTQELGGKLPDINEICKDPSIHMGKYFISTVPQNRKDKVAPAHRGLHYNDKYYLAKNFNEILDYLELYHANPELIMSGLSKSLKGGSVYLDDSQGYRENEEIILAYASTIDNEKFEETVQKVLVTFTEKETTSKGSDENKPNAFNKHSRFNVEYKGNGTFQFYDKKLMMQEAFRIRLVNASKYMHLMDSLNITEDLPEDASYKRIEQIREDFMRDEQIHLLSPGLALLEIQSFDEGDKSDNKTATERGMLESNWLTQCFHNKGMSDKELENKLSSGIADLLVRKGFTNQMIEECKTASASFVYYFPFEERVTLITGEEGYIFTIFRVENGITQVKYSTLSEKWMQIDEAIMKLKESQKHRVFVPRHGDSEFSSMILRECNEDNAVVVFQEGNIPQFLGKMRRLPFRVATYLTSNKLPHITNLDEDDSVSSGAFMIESNGECLSVPFKDSKVKIVQSQSKQTHNKAFSVRATARYRTTETNKEQRWKIFSGIHSLRSISLTYDGYLNTPLPVHLYERHFKRYIEGKFVRTKEGKTDEGLIEV